MAKQVNRKMIGGFVLIAVVIMAASVVIFGSGDWFKKSLKYVLYFPESVKGLNVGAPVLYRGFQVGEVKRVLIHSDMTSKKDSVLVYVDLYPESVVVVTEGMEQGDWRNRMSDLIDRGLRAQLVPQSLITGKLVIELNIHAKSRAVLKNLDPNFEEIPTIPSTMSKLEGFLAKVNLQDLIDKATSLLSRADHILQNEDIEASISEFKGALGDARGLLQKVDGKVDPLTDNLNSTLTDTRTLVNNVNEKVDPVSQTLVQALKSVDTAAESVDDLLGKRSPTRAELDNVLKELTGAARSMRILADYLQQHPEALLKGKGNKNY